MYPTTQVDAVATISELRAKTSELLDHVRAHKSSVLIQKNNEPYAVLLSWEAYQELVGSRTGEGMEGSPRPPRRLRKAEGEAS